MKRFLVTALMAVSLLLGIPALALAQQPDPTAEAVRLLAGQRFAGRVGGYQHVLMFKMSGQGLQVSICNSNGNSEFANAEKCMPGMGYNKDLPVQTSWVKGALQLQFSTRGGSYTLLLRSTDSVEGTSTSAIDDKTRPALLKKVTRKE